MPKDPIWNEALMQSRPDGRPGKWGDDPVRSWRSGEGPARQVQMSRSTRSTRTMASVSGAVGLNAFPELLDVPVYRPAMSWAKAGGWRAAADLQVGVAQLRDQDGQHALVECRPFMAGSIPMPGKGQRQVLHRGSNPRSAEAWCGRGRGQAP